MINPWDSQLPRVYAGRENDGIETVCEVSRLDFCVEFECYASRFDFVFKIANGFIELLFSRYLFGHGELAADFAGSIE